MSNFDQTMGTRVRAERARAELDDDDVETLPDGTKVLRDGRSLVVPMFMADGSVNPKLTFEQRLVAEKARQALRDKAMADHQQSLFDATERRLARTYGLDSAAQLHQPGFQHAPKSAMTRDALVKAYADYTCDLETAYMNPPTGFGSRGPTITGRGSVAGSACTVRSGAGAYGVEGSAGTMQWVDGELVCVSDDLDFGDGLSARDAARIEYEDTLTNAWRHHPTGDVADNRVPAGFLRRDDVSTKDSATVARDHQQTMSKLYAQVDAELSEKWRGSKA